MIPQRATRDDEDDEDDGAVTVVYTNTNSPAQDCNPTTTLYSFAVEALTSFDDGHTWQTKSRMFQRYDRERALFSWAWRARRVLAVFVDIVPINHRRKRRQRLDVAEELGLVEK